MASLANGKMVYEEAATADANDVPENDANIQLSLMSLRRANTQLQKRLQILEKR